MCSPGLIRELTNLKIKNRKRTQTADIRADVIFFYSLIQCPGAWRKLSIIGDLPSSVIHHLVIYLLVTDEKVIDKN